MANEKLVRIKNRFDKTENWSKTNPILQMGEIGIAYDFVNVSTPGSPSVPKVKIGTNDEWNYSKYVIGSCISDDNGADSFNNTNLKDTGGIGRANRAFGQFSHAEGRNTQAGGSVKELTYTNTAGVYTADGNYKSETSLYLYKDDKFLEYATGFSATYDSTTKKTTFTFKTKYTDSKLYFLIPNSDYTLSNNKIPLGSGAHSEGVGTIAFGDAQHVEGKYNMPDYKSEYVHIVGNGTNSTRHNAYTLDWDGNATFAGSIYTNNNHNAQHVKLTNFSLPKQIKQQSDLDNAEIGSLFYMPIRSNNSATTPITITGTSNTTLIGIKGATGVESISSYSTLDIYPGAKFTYNNITYTITNIKYSTSGWGQTSEYLIDKPLNEAINYQQVTLIDNTFTVNPGDTIMRTIGGWVKINIEYSKASNVEVVDNLTSTDTDKALSAKQGKLLNDKIINSENRLKINYSHPYQSNSTNNSFTVGFGDTGRTFMVSSDDFVIDGITELNSSCTAIANTFSDYTISIYGGSKDMYIQSNQSIYPGTKLTIVDRTMTGDFEITAEFEVRYSYLINDENDDTKYVYNLIVDKPINNTVNKIIKDKYDDETLYVYGGHTITISHISNNYLKPKIGDIIQLTECGWVVTHNNNNTLNSTISKFSSHKISSTLSYDSTHLKIVLDEKLSVTFKNDLYYNDSYAYVMTKRGNYEIFKITNINSDLKTIIVDTTECARLIDISDYTYFCVIVKDNITGVNSAHIEGYDNMASGDFSHVEGSTNLSANIASHAEGYRTIAAGKYSHTEGERTKAVESRCHAEGSETKAIGIISHAEGLQTTAQGDYSHSQNTRTTASGNSSHAEGSETTASGFVAHAEGANTTASGDHSHTEGGQTKATGDYTHAEGMLTQATAIYSHSEGHETVASGEASHSEGYGSKSEGKYSHSEGTSTSSGIASHSEGSSSATGNFSHSEGQGTKATAESSHAEGRNNNSLGVNAHTEGYNNTVSSDASNGHAEGQSNKVMSGEGSHVEGIDNIAYGNGVHVQGKHAKTSADDNYLHVVGNGEWGKPSNAHTLDVNGNAWFKGSIKVGGTGYNDGYSVNVATQDSLDQLEGRLDDFQTSTVDVVTSEWPDIKSQCTEAINKCNDTITEMQKDLIASQVPFKVLLKNTSGFYIDNKGAEFGKSMKMNRNGSLNIAFKYHTGRDASDTSNKIIVQIYKNNTLYSSTQLDNYGNVSTSGYLSNKAIMSSYIPLEFVHGDIIIIRFAVPNSANWGTINDVIIYASELDNSAIEVTDI